MPGRWLSIREAAELVPAVSRRQLLRRLHLLDARSGGRLLRRLGTRKLEVSTEVLERVLRPEPEEPDEGLVAELADLRAKLTALRNAHRALRRRVERLEALKTVDGASVRCHDTRSTWR